VRKKGKVSECGEKEGSLFAHRDASLRKTFLQKERGGGEDSSRITEERGEGGGPLSVGASGEGRKTKRGTVIPFLRREREKGKGEATSCGGGEGRLYYDYLKETT